MQHRSGYPVFVTYIEANHIHKREDLYSMLHITDDDKREIRKLARDPKIAKRLLEYVYARVPTLQHAYRCHPHAYLCFLPNWRAVCCM